MPTATAQAVRAAAQHTTLAGATGVVIEMNPRKEPGTEAPGQVKGVGWEPISDIVNRLVEELASGGRNAPFSLASASKLIVADQFAGRLPQYLSGPEYPAPRALSGSAFTAVARHSAEAELNGLAVSPTREAHGPTATAQAVRAAAQHTTLAGATGVVIGMRPRKEPGTEAPGQVVSRGDECHRREVPMTLMPATGRRGIRGQRKLG